MAHTLTGGWRHNEEDPARYPALTVLTAGAKAWDFVELKQFES
jgi:hypothetical protein